MNPTYVSLFSGAGIGCHGLDMAGFRCLATVEITPRRIEVQKFNNKCADDSAYISGDMESQEVFDFIVEKAHKGGGADVVIATPPCQGMSRFNHKKKNEKQLNSLVISAIKTVDRLQPKVFIFENVSMFFKTQCHMPGNSSMPIREAIDSMLGGQYHILFRVTNLKNYGCRSSRTRALAIGVDKRCGFSPLSIFPDWSPEQTLANVIGDLPTLPRMGQIDSADIYHAFKPYEKRMQAWVSGLKEGQSAFDRQSPAHRPHRIINGKRVENKNGNGDKYRRQRWDAIPPCIHTRSDILASQNTIHPRDNRVFSIREIMRMQGIPDKFRWSAYSRNKMSEWTPVQKQEFLRKSEANIRQCLGEAVPPMVIFNIAKKIAHHISRPAPRQKIGASSPVSTPVLHRRISTFRGHDIGDLMHAIECANAKKEQHAAYYTPPVTAFKTLQMFPDLQGKKHLRILEPSVGAGQILRFLPGILAGYESVVIDVMDIDGDVLGMAKQLAKHISMPDNVKINFIHGDFLDYPFGDTVYDAIIGNPPFRKMLAPEARHYGGLLKRSPVSRNTFAFFLMKAMDLARHVVFVSPKSFLNAPEYNDVRKHVNFHHTVRGICDFGEEGFKGVKIETLAIAVETNVRQSAHSRVFVESVPRNIRMCPRASDIFSANLPYWVIYRNDTFDAVLDTMDMGIFVAFRDRQITKKHTSTSGTLRVIKSRNVQPGGIRSMTNDVYIEPNSSFAVQRYINRKDVFLVPNLSLSPRACFMPKDSVTDGSVAILSSVHQEVSVTRDDLAFFATDEFHNFYRVARNYGTRTLNIDSNSVHFFGVKRET